MFTAEAINPASRKRKITCSSCGISYSARDYSLLYESKKIVYFKYKNKIFCHECLYKMIAEVAGGEKMSFYLKSEGNRFKCVYEPDDDLKGGETPFSDLF